MIVTSLGVLFAGKLLAYLIVIIVVSFFYSD